VSIANDTTFYLVGLDANLERARGVFNLFYKVVIAKINWITCLLQYGLSLTLDLVHGDKKRSWPRP
jgi:hypothetical protein